MASALPFAARVVATHARDILARDRQRAQKLLAGINPHGPARFHELRKRGGHHHGAGAGGGGSQADAPSSDSTGVDVTDAGVTYTASVGVGSPATDYTLLIDTGGFLI